MTAASARSSTEIRFVRATVPLPTGVACAVTARARRSAQQNYFLGKSQVFAADLFLQVFPNRVENHVSVFDFQVHGLAVLFFG